MAVAALKVAFGRLPPGTAPELAAVLRPSPRPSRKNGSATATTALRVAACWLPKGTPKAAALAVAKGIGANKKARSRKSLAAAALALAAQQRFTGTAESRDLAAAAGRAVLRSCTSPEMQEQNVSASASALSLAAKRCPEAAGALTVALGRHLVQHAGAAPSVSNVTYGKTFVRSPVGRIVAFNECTSGLVCGQSSSSTSQQKHVRIDKAAPSGILHMEQGLPCTTRTCVQLPTLCQDTSARVFEQLWPPQYATPYDENVYQHGAVQTSNGINTSARVQLSPRAFEHRLQQSVTIFQDLQQISALSPTWARRADQEAWPATHAYLYQELGSRGQLRQRYSDSKRQLLVKAWIGQRIVTANADPTSGHTDADVVSRIAAFMP